MEINLPLCVAVLNLVISFFLLFILLISLKTYKNSLAKEKEIEDFINKTIDNRIKDIKEQTILAYQQK